MEKYLKIYTCESLCCILKTNTVLYKLIVLHLKKSVHKIVCVHIYLYIKSEFSQTLFKENAVSLNMYGSISSKSQPKCMRT